MAKPRRILNIEDSMGKHWDVNRALSWNGCPEAEHAMDAQTGLDMIERAVESGRPYDLLVLDMYFPISPGGCERLSGTYVMEELERRGIDLPIIVCSSARCSIPEILGCVHYNRNNDLNFDLKEFIDKL